MPSTKSFHVISYQEKLLQIKRQFIQFAIQTRNIRIITKAWDRMPQSNFRCINVSCNDCYPKIPMGNRHMIFVNCQQKILQAFLLLLNWHWLCLFWLSKCFPYFCRGISFLSIKSKSQASRGWYDIMTKVGCRNQVLSAIDCCNGTLQFANCE